ncbi:MAG: cohesin domain-containing protein [Saprospiraceae bacterium]
MKNSVLLFALLLSVSSMWAQLTNLSSVSANFLNASATTSELTLGMTNKTTKSGTEVTVDVYNQNMAEVLSMQYSMKWNPKVLKFKEVRQFGLPALSKDNFGKHLTPKGQLTIAWYDENLRGLSIPAGQVLYQLVFEVVGKAGDKAFINIVDYPTVIEVSNPAGQIIDLKGGVGTIKIQ